MEKMQFAAMVKKLTGIDISAEGQAKEEARLAGEREYYKGKYALESLDNTQLRWIKQAEKKLEVCQKCEGVCLDPIGLGYHQPVIEKITEFCIPAVPCRHGQIRRLEKLAKKSTLPERYFMKMFSDYEVTKDNERAVGYAKWFCKEQPQKGLYLFGGCGTGKTFLASLIGQDYMLYGKNVIFGDVPSLLEEIKKQFDKTNGREDVIGKYMRCGLLILDDFGTGAMTEWAAGTLYAIINERYNSKRPIVVTSNYTLEGLGRRISTKDEWAGKRIVSRLSEMCVACSLGSVDRRLIG